MELIREIAASSENVFFSKHAIDRLRRRGFADKDVIDGFKIGDIEGPVTPGDNHDEWKCKVVFPEPDINGRRSVGVVTIVIEKQELLVTTVMWVTG